jgi:hypothetical protein
VILCSLTRTLTGKLLDDDLTVVGSTRLDLEDAELLLQANNTGVVSTDVACDMFVAPLLDVVEGKCMSGRRALIGYDTPSALPSDWSRFSCPVGRRRRR